MQDRPDRQQLLEAFSTFFNAEVLLKLPSESRYYARVAGNVLEIVLRELALGPTAEQAERLSLQALLGETSSDLGQMNQSLCERIERGSIDRNDPRLIEHLWASTLAKLSIDQPRYAAYRREIDNT